jgi:hypothetical protein
MKHVFYEWTGSLLSLLGCFLLATNSSISKYGWPIFLIANVAMIIFGIKIGARGLVVQQIGSMALNCYGLYRVSI